MNLYSRFFFPSVLSILLFFVVCCDNYILQDIDSALYDNKAELSFGYVNSNEVLERAYQMATMEWTPIKDVPIRGGGFFWANKSVKGVPYSSVKEINTYLFQDVSYHTFMTAVHNPNSVLYTENISEPPYNGVNCATYYGAVCSSSIMWAYGISIPYYADQIKDLCCMERIECQQIDSLRICDIMWKNGHVQMIYNLEYEADTLKRVTTFETSDKTAHINTYSKERFRAIWNEGNYVGYRYKYLVYSNDPFNPCSLGEVIYNEDLCPSKGDKAIYRTDEEIVINIFDPSYQMISLEKDGIEVKRDIITGNYHTYKGLKPGVYLVRLFNGDNYSDPVFIEVASVSVSYTHKYGSQTIYISFESSATPEYLALCTITGNSLYYPLSEQNRLHGFVAVPRMDISEYYCKVIFRGEFGSVINQPIRVL